MKRILAISAAIALLAACAVAHVPEPTALNTPAGSDLGRLRAGRSLYVNRCSGCHRLHDVEEYSDPDWGRHVQEMIHLAKVKLEEGERQRLLFYLTTLNGRE